MLLLVLLGLVSSGFAATTAAPILSSIPAQCGTLFTLANCLTVTQAASFVDCNKTINRCFCLPTFDGNASPANPCQCNSPKQILFPASPLGGGILSSTSDLASWMPANWGFDDPICVDIDGLMSEAATTAKHKASVIAFFNNTLGSTPIFLLQTRGASLLNTLVSPNVKARLSPAGAFNVFDGVIEYFYGFVANPGFVAQSIDYISIAATGNTVAAKVNIFIQNDNFQRTGGHPPQFFNLSIFSFFTFDDQDLIESIDMSVPNLGLLLDIMNATTQLQNIGFTCQVLTMPTPLNGNQPGGTCGKSSPPTFPGGTNYTAQFNACMGVMLSKPYGTHNRMNSDTFVCRNLHMLLTPYNAAVHCPHVSFGGGGACVDFTYESYFQTNY